MSLPDLSALDVHKRGGYPAGYPANYRAFYAPVDAVHAALLDLIHSARVSLVVAMYGFTDKELADAMAERLADPGCYVQVSLDASQALGPYERKLLAEHQWPASSVALGGSEKGGLMHLKMCVVDGLDVVSGSTNWTWSGEYRQDNHLAVVRDPHVASEAVVRLGAVHAHMLTAHKGP